jgi:lipopolysaccharide export system permease protein
LEKKLDVTKTPINQVAGTSSRQSPPPRPGVAPPAVPRPWRRRFRLPMKIADAYLLGSVCDATLRGLVWFAGLLIAFSVITAVRKVVTDQLPVTMMFELVAYQMPRVFLFTLPISVLYGTVQTFTDLSTRGELTALGAGGMSLPRMVRAPMLWGLVLAIFAFWLQESIVPKAQRQYQNVISQRALEVAAVQRDFEMNDSKSTGARRIYAKVFDPKSRTLIGPRITIYNEDNQVGLEIIAERAQWDIEAGDWTFYNGRSRITPRIKVENPTMDDLPPGIWTLFKQMSVKTLPNPDALNRPADSVQYNLDKKNYEMLSISDMRGFLNKHPQWLAETGDPETRDFIYKRMKSLTFGIHDKIATPLLCLAVVLIGAPLGVRPQRSASAGIAMGLSLGVLLVYYILWSWVSQIGKAGVGNPLVLAYSPLALTLVIAAVLMKIKSR